MIPKYICLKSKRISNVYCLSSPNSKRILFGLGILAVRNFTFKMDN
jgi:hypothetical protein